MSFGFLTESALLPAKSKPIQVDGRSLVDLKAVVYAKEQKVKNAGVGAGGGSSGGAGLRALRGKRAAAASLDAASASRKDVFARSNRGVEGRSGKDEEERETPSRKQKAVERKLADKSKLYEKMAKGEVCLGSGESSLVDFGRKTGADLALLDARSSIPKRRRKPGEDASGREGSAGKRRRRHRGEGDSEDDDDNIGHPEDRRDEQEDEGDEEDDDPTSTEVNIVDEFGRDRRVTKGSKQHEDYLEGKRAEAERKAALNAEAEAFDARYSYTGNIGPRPRPQHGVSAGKGGVDAEGAGPWAWSSGRGRGVDDGDFETREGQDWRAGKSMAKRLEREGVGGAPEDAGGAKILSQWEKTLSGDQKEFLREVQAEAEASRGRHQSDHKRQRQDRKELLRRKQEARAATAAGAGGAGAAAAGAARASEAVPIDPSFLRSKK